MITLKLKFKMTDGKEKNISIKNIKSTAVDSDIRALGAYMADSDMLDYAGNKIESFIGAVVIDSKETLISA